MGDAGLVLSVFGATGLAPAAGGLVCGAQLEGALLLVITTPCALLAVLASRHRRRPSIAG